MSTAQIGTESLCLTLIGTLGLLGRGCEGSSQVRMLREGLRALRSFQDCLEKNQPNIYLNTGIDS